MALVDYFLKIEGIEGESQDSKHAKEIEIDSWSFGETNSGSFSRGGGGGAGKVNMQDFHFVKRVCKASPKLFQHCADGSHIPSATLTCRKAGKEQQEYYKVSFKDLLVSSYQTSGSGAADVVPLEEITLNFTAIKLEYREQKKDGTLGGAVNAEYNLKQMKAAF